MVSCRWGSRASRLHILRGGSLIFTTKFQEIPATEYEFATEYLNMKATFGSLFTHLFL